MKLWRPVGALELRRIYETGMKAFPPRLIDQPIFYPVTNQAYAQEIARDWNKNGYVVSFEIPDAYGQKFDKKIVGGVQHEELWVPAEELPEFNAQIVGFIETDWAVFHSAFPGLQEAVPSFGGLHEAFHSGTPQDQLQALMQAEDRIVEFCAAYNTLIYVTYPFWVAIAQDNSQKMFLAKLSNSWQKHFQARLCQIVEIT